MKVKFLPQDISVDVDPNKSVMELARENQLPISSSCNGMCSCAECRVYVVEGEAHVLPPSVRETELIGSAHFMDNRRLSCQLFCFGHVTVNLSEQLERKSHKRQQFLHSRGASGEKSTVLGDILVQQDQDMSKVNTEREREKKTTQPTFYRTSKKDNQRRDRGTKNFAGKSRNTSRRALSSTRHKHNVRRGGR